MNTTLRSAALGLGVIAAGGLAMAAPAHADAISAQQLSLLDQFNLIVLGNLSDTSDVGGSAFVGGDVKNGTFNVGLTNPTGSSYNTLTVAGSVDSSAGVNIENGGGFAVGGNAANITLNGATKTTASQAGGNVTNSSLGGALQYGGSLSGGNPNGVVATHVPGLTPSMPAVTTLAALSTTLSSLAATSTAYIDGGNNAVFNAVKGANGQAVFDISASLAKQIFSAGSFTFNLDGASSVIINVEGSPSIADNTNFNDTAVASDLLWNFVDTTSLAFNRTFAGTVLAPEAAVTNSSSIYGTVVAGSATLGGELYNDPFTGPLPDGGTPVPVPEPASGALLAAGLGALAMLRRQRAR